MYKAIDFFKKYRLNILFVLVLGVLLLYYIPSAESHYLQPDIDIIKEKSRTILFVTGGILLLALFISWLYNIKKFSDIFYMIIGAAIAALSFFLLFSSIFLSLTFFLNGLAIKQKVEKKYSVISIDWNNKNLVLSDLALNKIIWANELLGATNRKDIRVSDTIVVIFTKGLLNVNNDPIIK